MTFGGSTGEAVKDSSNNYPSIQQPGVHKGVKLVSVSNDSYTTNNDKYLENPLQLEFYKKEDETIYRHMHMELQPRESDEKSKTDNKVDRILYIVGKITQDNKEITGDTWEEFTSNVVKELEPFVNEKENRPELFLKLVGNVYNGRANLQIPGYKGFLERVDSGSMPTVSKSEDQKNQEYLNFGSGSPDKEESADLPDTGGGMDEGINDSEAGDDLPF